jgi:hypothetical protein
MIQSKVQNYFRGPTMPLPYSTSSQLFAAIGANANGAAFDWPGGRGVFSAFGAFGAGTCKLQFSPDAGVTWLDVDRSGDTYVTFTANGSGGFELPPCQIRAVLTGATAPSLSATAAPDKA